MPAISDAHITQTRSAFLSWIASRPNYAGKPEDAWNLLLMPTANGFLRSEQAQELRDTGLDVEAIIKAQRLNSVQPRPVPVPVPVTPIPHKEEPSTRVPSPAPVPAPQPVPQPVPQPASVNPLIDMIAGMLKEAGFRPEHAISAEVCERIAEDKALEVCAMVIGELEKQGKLQGACKGHTPQFSVVRRDLPERTVKGQAPKWFGRALKYAEVRQNILLVGPAGAGKSYGARMLAEAMELPFYPLSLTAGVDEGNVQGWLLPVGDNARFEYVCSQVVKAYTEGGVVLFDELDSADPNMLLILNAALDGNGFWSIPIRHKAPILSQHNNFIVCANANTHGHGPDRKFVGRNQLDGATLSRFRSGQINVDFDEDLEKHTYPAEVVTYGHMLRARLRAVPGQTRDVSTRDLRDWTKILPVVDSVEHAAYGYFSDWSEQELERVHARIDHNRELVTLL